jgi:hypothetical protein
LFVSCWLFCSRKTLIYLILTLNHIYPDYDFSQLRAHHFRKEGGISRAEELVDTHLIEVSKVSSNLHMFRLTYPLATVTGVAANTAQSRLAGQLPTLSNADLMAASSAHRQLALMLFSQHSLYGRGHSDAS